MNGWKPYLHTLLFSSFSNQPDAGEAFLFPTFRIYSRATFLAACAFTFFLALVERYLTHLLDTTLSLQPHASDHTSWGGRAKRKNSLLHPSSSTHTAARESASVYVNLPSLATPPPEASQSTVAVKVAARNVAYFGATLLRYVLMLIAMSMDWFMLLSLVSGLTLGHLCTDLYAVAYILPVPPSAGDDARRGEEVELLHRDAEDFDLAEDDLDARKEGVDYIAAAGAMRTHRRANSRQASIAATTPY